MDLSFRARLMTIVAATGMAFLLVILVSWLIGLREERKLAEIERRLVPKLALGPRLEAELGLLTRGLQDAAGAQDPEMLVETRALRDRLLASLASASDVLSGNDLARVRTAIEDYFDTAYDVAKRLVQGDRGEGAVRAMGMMQEQLSHVSTLLKETTRLDRNELNAAFASARAESRTAAELRLVIILICLLLVLALSVRLSRGLLGSLADVSAGLARFGSGDFTRLMPVTTRDELGALARDANQMAQNLGRLAAERDRNDWLKTGHSQVVNELRGELDLREIAQRSLRLLATYIEAPAGAFYFVADQDTLQLISQFALAPAGGGNETVVAAPAFRFGEGLVGQAALAATLTVIENPPPGYLRVRSGLGEGSPKAIVLVPLVHLGRVTGVLELALFRPFSDQARELLVSIGETLAIALEVARSRGAMRDLLAETRRQAQRLANQEHELTANNEELRAQQENLTRANEELEEQRRALEENNVALEESRQREEKKSQALADASAYKSRFLSNMSHELRTPLNSMLLLSNLLAENGERNLTDKQVDFAKTIHSAGKDLLALINQVLDLAKIEAGKQEIFIEPVPLAQFPERAQRVFAPLAHDKGLELVIEVAPSLPANILTDRQRVDQILTNLLGNAIKFTEHGSVTLRIGRPAPGTSLGRPDLAVERTVALVVTDTGIGIALQEQERVFAPFQQIDARTDRRYGGSGLGLSIARELALLLGGELQLTSAPGRGSTFTLLLPDQGPGATAEASPSGELAGDAALSATLAGGVPPLARVTDDRETLKPDEPHLLIIEDDPIFAAQLAEIIHARRFKVLIAPEGREGLRLAKTHRPQGIILDVRLPDIDGWAVMERLGFEPETRRIPVHFVSSLDAPERGLAMGAVGYLAKPATREELVAVVETLAPQTIERSRRILVVEDDTSRGERLVERLEGEGLQVRYVQNAGAALQALEHDKFSCMVLDLGLPDVDGLGFLERLRARTDIETPPVVVHTGRALTKDETRRLEEYAEAVVLKEGRSTERLLEEIRMFIQNVKARLPASRTFAPPRVPLADVHLAKRRILLVDDDMRTVYALSALLRAKGAEVFTADTGRAALEMLGEHPDTEGVLMDVMMPEMDGYEAMRRIRQDPRFERLPVIALTAKAMKGEREKCIEAGASDYLTKPIDADQLLTMLQAWLTESSQPNVGGP